MKLKALLMQTKKRKLVHVVNRGILIATDFCEILLSDEKHQTLLDKKVKIIGNMDDSFLVAYL